MSSSITATAWALVERGEPLRRVTRVLEPRSGEVVVGVAGCGVCHTDLGFVYDGVPTRHELPLVLGHEIAGRVVVAGSGAEEWLGRAVVVPAVMPCGECEACRAGRGPICPRQIFPGNDLDGGFATHVLVPARGLCPVPDLDEASVARAGFELETLAVVADAVSTPYQALSRAGVDEGDLVVVVGAGGVGGFAVQIAAARGATVVAVDVDSRRLRALEGHGLELGLDASTHDFKQLKGAVRALAAEHGIPSFRWKVVECSGSPAGQRTAFGLLGHGSLLVVVGYTPQPVELRLANLMALDASALGNWGCLPEHYPAVVELVRSGRVALAPFVEKRPLESINETLAELHDAGAGRRIVLIPEAA